MKKIAFVLLTIITVAMNPMLASDSFVSHKKEMTTFQDHILPMVISNEVESSSKSLQRINLSTSTMLAKQDLYQAQLKDIGLVLENLKQENHQYLLSLMQNSIALP